jgi:glycosyltransferase involved in cell wall biosynthesis
MRIIWFSSTATFTRKDLKVEKKYAGGSWIMALENEFRKVAGIELAIAFPNSSVTNTEKVEFEGITYYYLPYPNTKTARLVNRIFGRIEKPSDVKYYMDAVNDFKPEIIHIFGTENNYGQLLYHTQIPVVFHIQGILLQYINKWYAGISRRETFKFSSLKSLLLGTSFFHQFVTKQKKAMRERQFFAQSRFLMGRTEWDKNLANFFAPKAKYFHCEELLREPFLKSRWKPTVNCELKLVSVMNPEIYKGLDVILNTASSLKERGYSIKWQIAGLKSDEVLVRMMERKTGIRSSHVKVEYLGKLDAEKLVEVMLASDVFVHPSYIDNSPNSVCEAMLLGMPVIATRVGGIPSLITHGKDGILVQEGDPYDLAQQIINIVSDAIFQLELSNNAHERALKRHDKVELTKNLFDIYNTILASKT